MKKKVVPIKKREPTEVQIQKAFLDWLQLAHKDYYEVAFHIPNGGLRNPIEAAKFKRLGVKPGVPDLFIGKPNSGYAGMFIEFKTKKGTLTDYQVDFLNRLVKTGYCCAVVHSIEQAMDAFKWYFDKASMENKATA
jgi:VRR-NUC domain